MAYGTVIHRCETLSEAETRAKQHAYGSGVGVLYRVEAVSYSYTIDADREEYGTTAPQLELTAFTVLRWTEHGATLFVTSGARNKWVDLRPGAKQWASRTAQEAIEQLAARRNRQLYILAAQMRRAERERDLCSPWIEK